MPTTQGIKLDDNTHKRLKALADIRDRSPHWLMITAIKNYLEREENYEREKREDMERWEHYQLTGEFISHKIAAQWLSDLASGKARKCPK